MGYIYSQIGKGSFINEQQDVLQLTKNQKFDDLCELVTQMKGLGIALEDILDCCTSVFKKGDFTYDPTH